MIKRVLSFLFVSLYVWLFFVPLWGFAQDDAFVLIPESEDYGSAVKKVWENSGRQKFWKVYNEEAEKMNDDLWWQIGSGIMNWDTIFSLLKRVVIFVSNSALVVGAAMIIYAGYLYASHVFTWADASTANSAIKYAVMGIVVVIFSYSILRWVIHAFL